MDKGKKTVFLDRDGVINVQAAPHDYIRNWSQFYFLPHVEESVKRLNDHGFQVIIVTNQRGVARGLMTLADVEDIHSHMQECLKRNGAHVDGIYICPHEEELATAGNRILGFFFRQRGIFL